MNKKITVPFDLEESLNDRIIYVFEDDVANHLQAGWKYFSHGRYVSEAYQTPVIYTLVR